VYFVPARLNVLGSIERRDLYPVLSWGGSSDRGIFRPVDPIGAIEFVELLSRRRERPNDKVDSMLIDDDVDELFFFQSDQVGVGLCALQRSFDGRARLKCKTGLDEQRQAEQQEYRCVLKHIG
jgi:hypothetical protein